jgi:hypothetical protein
MEFEWTDDRVLKFARICTQGSYGDYTNCKNAEQKLERFKELESQKPDTHYELFAGTMDALNSICDDYKTKKS